MLKVLGLGTLLLMVLASVNAASAQESYNYSVALMGTIGGPLDADSPDPGLDNTGLQAQFSWISQPRLHVVIRGGQVEFTDERFGAITEPELSYASIGGEYRYSESFYESGFFIGLGAFRLEGLNGLQEFDDTSLGLTVGVTGEFPITRSWFVKAELLGLYADLEGSQLFGFAHVGVGFHF